MRLRRTWMPPVLLLLSVGLVGCGQSPPPVVNRPGTPTRDQAVEVLSQIQSAIDAGVVWRHELDDGKRLFSEIQSAIEAGEEHSGDFEARVNLLKHFHRAPEWNGKRFQDRVIFLLSRQALSPAAIRDLSKHGAWGRADQLFDKDRLRRRVALHEVKADDCYALVLENGKAEAVFHWNGKTFTILHYSEPAVRDVLNMSVGESVRDTQSKDGSARALSHRILGDWGPDVKNTIPAISKLLTHDDPWQRISAAVTLWKIDRLSSVSVPPLVSVLADAKLDASHRAMAAEALGIIGPQASGAKAALGAAMGEKPPKLRMSAAWALWKTTGDLQSTRPVMLDLLQDGNLDVFFGAAKTLGEMGWDKESLSAFVAALQANPSRATGVLQLRQTLVAALILQHHFRRTGFRCFASHLLRCEALACR
ncbi:MAG: HEAT repeat domain-containing protein, partial [Sedimentisphaerales bacterium]|nr:HEAT repeat domain-containing protein [Sedimentisphaerales bacterium]